MRIITLTTDFGQKDGFSGVMKGVIWKIAPRVQIVDITHEVGPQNIAEAALILRRSVAYFPTETIHVVVVDPGVGSKRRPLLARIGDQYFVGPDNGLLTAWLERFEGEGASASCIHLNRPQYWLAQVSNTFHGRDLFAPVAAHLANGIPMEAFGDPLDDPTRIHLPHPQPTPAGWQGEIIHIDHYGNLATNLRREHLAGRIVAAVKVGAATIDGLANTFGERPNGEPVTFINSDDELEIAIVNGNAAARLNAAVGTPIEVEWRV